MAFTPEDGSGVTGANAYALRATVKSHHDDRGNSVWNTFTSTQQEAAIIRASDYIDKRFGRRFRGFRQLKDQGLEWPRLDAFDDDGYLLNDVPVQITKATAEYALRALLCGVLAPDPILPVPKQSFETGNTDREDDVITGEVTRRKDKVGPLEEERWYQSASQTAAENLGAGAKSVQSSLVNDFVIPEYPEADLWIEELLSGPTIELLRGN
jgi:hypothetical protein